MVLSLLGTLVVVAAVLLLAYVTTRFLALRLPGGGGRRGRTRRLTVVEQLAAGKDARLLLVRCQDRYLLLGVTPGGVTCLKEFSPQETAGWDQDSGEDGPTAAPPSFRDQLQALLERKKP